MRRIAGGTGAHPGEVRRICTLVVSADMYRKRRLLYISIGACIEPGDVDRASQSVTARRGSPAASTVGDGGPRRIRVCQFCAEKNKAIDYKNVDLLRGLVSDRGKIRPRRQTGTCARHQRQVAEAIKRARHMALLPFAGELSR